MSRASVLSTLERINSLLEREQEPELVGGMRRRAYGMGLQSAPVRYGAARRRDARGRYLRGGAVIAGGPIAGCNVFGGKKPKYGMRGISYLAKPVFLALKRVTKKEPTFGSQRTLVKLQRLNEWALAGNYPITDKTTAVLDPVVAQYCYDKICRGVGLHQRSCANSDATADPDRLGNCPRGAYGERLGEEEEEILYGQEEELSRRPNVPSLPPLPGVGSSTEGSGRRRRGMRYYY